MLYNCHCHVFNFQAVYSHRTRLTILNRLLGIGLSEEFAQFLLRALEHFATHGNGVDLRAEPAERVDSLIRAAGGGRGTLAGTLRGMVKASEPGWWQRFRSLLRLGVLDARAIAPDDLLDYLCISLAMDMDQVTDRLLADLDEDWAIAPQMMDISDDGPGDQDRFEAQLAATVRQVERYPGRVFPFVAATPKRPNLMDRVRQALEGGCVGVKLYPSLGYRVEFGQDMHEVLEHCSDTATPVLMHCNRQGFKSEEGYEQYCRPDLWWELLKVRYPGLRICFGHFGGDEDIAVAGRLEGWPGEILAMMRDQELAGRVYADVAYHDKGMSVGPQRLYFNQLKALIHETSACAKQLLWGTDYWLVRVRLSERSYLEYFLENLGRDGFDVLARDNPPRFLGLDTDPPAKNIMRQVRWLEGRGLDLKGQGLPDWLRKAAA